MAAYRYSEWDGTQDLADLHQDDVMDAMAEDLIFHGDVNSALRRLSQWGMQGRLGGKLQGLQDLLRQVKEQRQKMLEQYNLGSAVDDIRQRLQEIVDTERKGIQKRREEMQKEVQEKPAPEKEVGRQALERAAAKNLETLDQLPQDPGGQIKELSNYDFMDPDARQKFQELMDMLKQSIMDSYFQNIQQRLQGLTPQDIQQLKDMVQNLNQMLREQKKGGKPDFQRFMQQFGHMFGPDRPSSLEELMNMLQQHMSQMDSLLQSLSPEQREALNSLMQSVLGQEGLQGEMAELMANLESLSPMRGAARYPFQGDESLSLSEAMKLMEALQELNELEKQLEKTHFGASPQNIDAERVRRLLGEEAAENLDYVKRMADMLEEAGYIFRKGNRLELTPKAMRKIGQKALRDTFSYLKKARLGKHPVERRGSGPEQGDDTKRYEFGDTFFVHLERTLRNALEREGPGTPLKLRPDDFEVYETEHMTQCSTVLMLDLSWSMPLRGKFLAAKKVALALESLIRTQFPRDNLYLVGFSDYAREMKSETLPQISWNDYFYGTNMQHGFMLSRRLLARHKGGTRQIIMITDGEPTAHIERGRSYFEYPPNPRTLELTLLQAKRCAQDGIAINTFMLDKSPHLMQFIDELARVNKGRVFYTSPETLGQYLLVDYIANKKRRAA